MWVIILNYSVIVNVEIGTVRISLVQLKMIEM